MVAPLLAGRYRLYEPIASGGMATVHFGRQVGEAGFARTIAIKRVHPKHFGKGAMVSGLVDEARLASRIQHPNVVPTLDVFQAHGELFVVMEFVMGETLARLQRVHMDRGEPMPVPIALSIAIGMLQGLHAAHEAKNERGQPLSIVHRDVSPQNVLVGVDGLARVLDFGIAKAEERLTSTLNGQVKGKPRYMAPEQIRGEPVTRRTDIFAAGIVIWESLAGRRLYESDAEVVVAYGERRSPDPAAKHNPNVPAKLDAVLRRALVFEAEDRFEDAATFALALEEAGDVASPRRVSEWVKTAAGASLRERAEMIAAIERESSREKVESAAQSEETRPEIPPLLTRPEAESALAAERAGDEWTKVGPAPDAVTVVAPPLVIMGARELAEREAPPVAPASADDSLESSTVELEPRAALGELRVTAEPAARRPPSRRWPSAAMAIVALLTGGVAAAVVFSRPAAPAKVPAASAAPTGETVAAVASHSAPPLFSPAASSVMAAASSAPPAQQEAVPSIARFRPPALPPAASAAGTHPPPPLEPQPKPADPCSPPYVIDKNNVKRFKPECL